MKWRYLFVLSLLVIGLLSACKSTVNDYGRDVTNNDNMNDRTGTQINYSNRYNPTRVRFDDVNRGRNQTNNPINSQRNRRITTTNNSLDTKRNGLVNDNYQRRVRDNYVRNTGDLNGFNEPRMRVADRAADRVVALKEVDAANVIVSDNNAYVAAKLENRAGSNLTSQIERKIAERVRSVDRDIDNVYVSVNPDFYDRTTNYARDIRNGQPISGFFDEFTETVRRIFPTNVR